LHGETSIAELDAACSADQKRKPEYAPGCTAALLQKVIRLPERASNAPVQVGVQKNPHFSRPYSAEREKTLTRLGANIRRERTSRQISQDKLAQLAEINPRTVAKIEAGELNIKRETLERIGRAIGCPIGILTGEIDGQIQIKERWTETSPSTACHSPRQTKTRNHLGS
jgi:ribosome-binding protein aMBF1 (putative translation factor)